MRHRHLRGLTLLVGGVLGVAGVAAGAFGAHGLRSVVTPEDLDIWRTGAAYHQLHAVLVVMIGLWGHGSKLLGAACVLLSLGIIIFSGTLYAMVLGGPRILGAVTPVGGLCLMSGWACLAAAGWIRLRSQRKTSAPGDA